VFLDKDRKMDNFQQHNICTKFVIENSGKQPIFCRVKLLIYVLLRSAVFSGDTITEYFGVQLYDVSLPLETGVQHTIRRSIQKYEKCLMKIPS
jgi:hypothetical protein